MIQSNELKKISNYYTECDDPELVEVYYPEGFGDYEPKEWVDKAGIHRLEPMWLAKLNNIDLMGSGLLGFAGVSFIPDLGYYGRIDIMDNVYNTFIHAREHNGYPITLVDSAIAVSGIWSEFYYHFLIDHLPQLMIADGFVDKVIVPYNSPNFVVDLIKKWTKLEVIQNLYNRYRVEELVVVAPTRQNGMLRKTALDKVRLFCGNIKNAKQNLYVSRVKASSRYVQNEIPALAGKGFRVVEAEDYTAAQQMALFEKSDIIMGAHGSGLTNMVWGRPRVVELVNPNYTNPCMFLLSNSLLLDCYYIACQSAPNVRDLKFVDQTINEDMILDPKHVDKVMEKLNA